MNKNNMTRKILTLLLLCVTLGVSAQDEGTEEKPRKAKKENPKKALKELQQKFDQLQNDHVKLQEAYKALQTKDSTLQADIQVQEEALRQQEAYHEQCLNNLYQEYTDYLDEPFSTISLQKIGEIKDFAARYADVDPNAPTLLTRAEDCKKHKQNYDHLMSLLSQPFDINEIKNKRTELKDLRDMAKEERWDELAMSKAQWNETDTIDLFYARYQPGVKWLQNVMKKCEQQYRSDGLNAANRADVVLSKDIRQNIISDADKKEIEGYPRRVSQQGNIADYILLIPWLRERYEIFISEQNPLKPSPKTLKAIKEIQDINTGL